MRSDSGHWTERKLSEAKLSEGSGWSENGTAESPPKGASPFGTLLKNKKNMEFFMEKKLPSCDQDMIHVDVVEKVRGEFPNDEIVFNIADFFKIFGDSTRFKILYALDKEKLCVCDISALLKMSTSAVSHQLRVLRDSNLVKTERDGKIIYYSLADDHVKQIIECGMDHILEKGK